MFIPSNAMSEKIISTALPSPPTEKAKHVRRLRRLKISSWIVITIGLGCGLGTVLTLNELMEVLSRRLPDLSDVIFPFLFGFLALAGIISSLILLSHARTAKAKVTMEPTFMKRKTPPRFSIEGTPPQSASNETPDRQASHDHERERKSVKAESPPHSPESIRLIEKKRKLIIWARLVIALAIISGISCLAALNEILGSYWGPSPSALTFTGFFGGGLITLGCIPTWIVLRVSASRMNPRIRASMTTNRKTPPLASGEALKSLDQQIPVRPEDNINPNAKSWDAGSAIRRDD